MRSQPKLFDELMGQFDLINTVEVFRGNHPNETELHFTVLHEEAHRKAVSSTTYGKVQHLLATVLRESSKSGSPLEAAWSSRAEALLAQTIKYSWFAHEGFAVSRERMYGKLMYPDHPLSDLPDDYEEAYQRYQQILQCLPENLKLFGVVTARAIVEAVLNTDIIRKLSNDEFTPDSVGRAVEETDQPDRRLEALLKAVRAHKLPSDFGASSISQIQELFKGTPLAAFPDISDAVARLYTRIGPETIDAMVGFDAIATNTFREYFSVVAPDLSMISPHDAGPEVVAFHNRVAEQFEKKGVTIPRAKVGTMQEGALQGTNVKFRSPERPPQFIDQSLAESFVAALLNTDYRLIVQPGLWLPPSSTFGTHLLFIVPITMEPVGEKTPEGYQPYGVNFDGCYALSGSLEYIHGMAKRLQPRLLQVVVGPSVVSVDDWTVADDIRKIVDDIWDQKHLIYTLPQFDTASLLHLLSTLEKKGIQDCKVIGGDRHMLYLAIWVPSNLIVVVKLSTSLPWIQKTHGEPFPDFVYRALAEETNLQELGFLVFVPALDEGGFLSPF